MISASASKMGCSVNKWPVQQSEIEQEIRTLDPPDQEHLVRVLLEELEGSPDASVKRALLEEAQRRSRELDTGAVQTVPAEEVFAKARADLKRR